MIDRKAAWPNNVGHEIATLALNCISMETNVRPNFVVILRKLRELLNMEIPTPEASQTGSRNYLRNHQQVQKPNPPVKVIQQIQRVPAMPVQFQHQQPSPKVRASPQVMQQQVVHMPHQVAHQVQPLMQVQTI